MSHIVLGITGGIAAYKAAELASRIVQRGNEVRCVMTKNATEFIAPLTLRSLTNAPVVTDMFSPPESWEIEHIALANWADLFLVAPATANIIAKFSSGIADDFLSTTLLATPAPVLMAPAMNSGMYTHPVTQRNLETLSALGVHFVGPGVGRLACGTEGPGRLADVDDILQALEEILRPAPQDMHGLRVMITAGPTRESLDPVRYITNHSSGKMGIALAEMARRRGAEVDLVLGPVSVAPPKGVRVLPVVSTQDLQRAVLGGAADCDIVIQAAAPADFRPEQVAEQKIKKQDGSPLVLRLVQNPDVAAALGAQKRPGQTLVAFAAETTDLLENARRKMEKKNCDMIVANDVTRPGAAFGGDTNIVTLITREDCLELPVMSKTEVAEAILTRVMALRQAD